mgnify:CR=1 FL=1
MSPYAGIDDWGVMKHGDLEFEEGQVIPRADFAGDWYCPKCYEGAVVTSVDESGVYLVYVDADEEMYDDIYLSWAEMAEALGEDLDPDLDALDGPASQAADGFDPEDEEDEE